MKRSALVLGAIGQTGSFMCEWLLAQDYDVYGMIRRTSTVNPWRIAHILDRVHLIEGDLTDDASLRRVLLTAKPNEIYNFASQSHVGVSFLEPIHTSEVTGVGALRLFDAVRMYTSLSEHVKIYQASSSEQFGQPIFSPQNEETPMRPISPYGCAKLFAHTMAQIYRKAYGMFISCGIAFNHESPRRSEEFVTRKITRSLAMIKMGQLSLLRLGNLSAKRDWMHAKDVAVAAWLMLQHNQPDDFVLASGQEHSVQEFVEYAFNYAGLDWQQYVRSDPQLLRPLDIQSLIGNAIKAQQHLGWKPSMDFPTLVREMVDADLAAVGYRDSSTSEGSSTPTEIVGIDPAPIVSEEQT